MLLFVLAGATIIGASCGGPAFVVSHGACLAFANHEPKANLSANAALATTAIHRGPRVASSSTGSRDGNNAATPRLAGPNNIAMTLRIDTVFMLSGCTKVQEVAELKALFDAD